LLWNLGQERAHFNGLIQKLSRIQFADNRDPIAFGHEGAGAGELSGLNPRRELDTPVDKRLVQRIEKRVIPPSMDKFFMDQIFWPNLGFLT
jgi:hypothetical protein